MSGILFIPLMPWEGGLVVPTAAAVTYYLTRSGKTTAQVSVGVLTVAVMVNLLELQF